VGKLLAKSSGQLHQLHRHQILGRSSTANLRLDERRVSGRHASLRWDGGSWQLKDLHSRNGTFLNGCPLTPGTIREISEGTEVSFGSRENMYVLTDGSAPPSLAMLVSANGDSAIQVTDGLCVLPSATAPELTIYRDEHGSWWRESALTHETVPLTEGVDVLVRGERFQFTTGGTSSATAATEGALQRLYVRDIELVFSVPSAEECVQLDMKWSGGEVSLGSRSAYYLLLTLARVRLGLLSARPAAPAPGGWLLVDNVESMLRTSKEQINVDVFRIRQAFRDQDIGDPAAIIQRQRNLMRIGTDAISVRRV
jgi:hypothetical protein